MSTLLVCAATLMELQAFSQDFTVSGISTHSTFFDADNAAGIITGVGIPITMSVLPSEILRVKPSCILNIGITGAYPGSGLQIGDIVMGTSEVFGDIGFELPEYPSFRPISSTPMGKPYAQSFPLRQCDWRQTYPLLKYGAGCTVNTCTGTVATGLMREKLYSAQFETMEGAAVAMVGKMADISVLEIRAISNIAADRDMRPENIKLAIENLANFFQHARLGKLCYA